MSGNIKLIENYSNHNSKRERYYRFISSVFPGCDFKTWHSKGFWTDDYIQYSFVESGEIISNVSATLMKVFVNGKLMNGVQLGAVGTIPEYRKLGLSKILMNYVIDKYKAETDIIFLFANDSVTEFYPKFGFNKQNQFLFVKKALPLKSKTEVRKLNLFNGNDYNLLLRLLKERKPITRLFGAANYDFIVMWHVFNKHWENIYYLSNYDALLFIKIKDDALHVYEAVCKAEFDINHIVNEIAGFNKVSNIIFYFPPDQIKFSYDSQIEYSEAPLFILGDISFGKREIKFPETAIT
ncbi:MAG: GNAT family N-acetyltransferase [Melioribacteraceae bacterium]|nr:GNAT family N-acetyltransferase [Melioribacteraceae bacterium]MCF8356429.1 GNAT family N-acetyltransferase [Melioribacteraceae bacterium]MCF8395784.1 GNAT family N-acetyltransferase [Melioribacteraceae bacterium]MCF8420913.1 GNAT family N-acetyltransferase [Melioribacteraceae bacterium]